MPPLLRAFALACAVIMLTAGVARAQLPGSSGPPMPDASQMSGVPLPMADVPAGTVTVRVVRGAMSNPVVGHPVELFGPSGPVTEMTNDAGRAEFAGLAIGARVKAVTTVDGERLESQEFAMPGSSGVRLALVATDPAAATRAEEDRRLAQAPAQPGTVVLGGDSRFVVEMGDEALNVFCILEVVNTASTPVQPPELLVFELPDDAVQPGLLDGSSPQAQLLGDRVTVSGPFAPGKTLVQFAYAMPIAGGSLSVEQPLPVPLTAVNIMAQRVGDLQLTSPQLAQQRDMEASGARYAVGNGPGLRAGDAVRMTFTGLPHRPAWPLNVALALAVFVLLAGAWGSMRPGRSAASAHDRRAALEAERDRLFAALTALEQQHRNEPMDADRYAGQRRELVAALERIYAELDEEAAA